MQINSKTHCPTCGSECKIIEDGETNYYIPIFNTEVLAVIYNETGRVSRLYFKRDNANKYIKDHPNLKLSIQSLGYNQDKI